MASQNDQDLLLVQKAKTGNSRAFGHLVEMYQDRVLALVYDFVGDYDTAKDIAQDIFMKIFLNLSNFTGQAKFSTWIYRIVVNTCIDYKRKLQRSPLKRIANTVSFDRQKQSQRANSREALNLDFAINNLSDQQRIAIILRYFHGMKIAQIARIMECGTNTVRTHIFRGIEKLRKSIKTINE